MSVLYFTAPWCAPCRVLGPFMDELAPDARKVNIDDEPELAESYDVRSVPTLVKVDGSKELDRLVGLQPKPALKKWLES